MRVSAGDGPSPSVSVIGRSPTAERAKSGRSASSAGLDADMVVKVEMSCLCSSSVISILGVS